MNLPVIPVTNAILPRIHGIVRGAFLDEDAVQMLQLIGQNGEILVCPWIQNKQELCKLGMCCRIVNLSYEMIPTEPGQEPQKILFAVLEGMGRAKAQSFTRRGILLLAQNLNRVDLHALRHDYPVVCGAGWHATGGLTERKDSRDIPITIEGFDIETNRKVSLHGNVGGLVSMEQAHTIEHALIRSLGENGFCSPRSLVEAIAIEGQELLQSVEIGMEFSLPEVFGVTGSGSCGNPLSQMARFYLNRELIEQVRAGGHVHPSLLRARKRTMSRLTSELHLTDDPALRGVSGLKRGMMHDDTPLTLKQACNVLRRFPLHPWE